MPSAASSEPLVRVADVAKIHGAGRATEVRALDGISFEIERGGFVAIVGESGSGKTTLMHVLGALDRPTRGTVEIDGVSLGAAPAKALAGIRARKIGFVFQGANLIPSLDALENVVLAIRYAGREGDARSRARELLGEVGLSDRLHHRPGELSGGQQQRVAIARALANEPPLLLADEPTGELDSHTADEVLALFERLWRERAQTIVVVTHAESVWRRAERVLTLRDGRLESDIRHRR